MATCRTSNFPSYFPGSQTLDSGMTSAQSLSTNLARAGSEVHSSTFAVSKEQIFSPIEIKSDLKKARKEVPSIKEPIPNEAVEQGAFPIRGTILTTINPNATNLDPYFSETTVLDADGQEVSVPAHFISDFSTAVNDTNSTGDGELEDEDDTDITLKKSPNTEGVRTIGLRGPILVSGWGFDIGDKPVPNKSKRWITNPDYDPNKAAAPDNPFYLPNPTFSDGDTFKMDPKYGSSRKDFESGPVHLLWDRERQVWSGGLPMLMGVATSDVDAPPDPTAPTEFTIEVLRERGQEVLHPEEIEECDENNPCPEGFTCSNTTGYCEQETITPFMPLPRTPESIILKNFDPSMSQKLVTRNRERTALSDDWPDQDCACANDENPCDDCENANLPGKSKCEDNKCVEIPPGAHDWLENPSLVWVLAIKMNYVWIPFYIGCPPECLTADHCVSLYKDDPNFEDLPGVESAANWECNDGECVFSGA